MTDLALLGFADPGLDLLSPSATQSWYDQQWSEIATTLGFAQSLRRRPTGTDLQARVDAALHAFAASRSGVAVDRVERLAASPWADSQVQVLEAIRRRSRETGGTWKTITDPSTVPGGACYASPSGPLRAFLPDTAPGYFGEGWSGPPPRASSNCGWDTPLVLFMGTFPWVYSGRLDDPGPAMAWPTPAAILGLGAVADMLDPVQNLREDAQAVALAYHTFVTHTRPGLAQVPVVTRGVYAPGITLRPGQLYLQDGRLHAHHASTHLATFTGTRGHVAVSAYNYCTARFVAFFTLRSAAVRALRAMPPAVQALAQSSTDPALRDAAEKVLRG